MFLCACLGAGGALGAGPPPHSADQPRSAGAGGTPGDFERRLCCQGDCET